MMYKIFAVIVIASNVPRPLAVAVLIRPFNYQTKIKIKAKRNIDLSRFTAMVQNRC